MRRTSKPSGRRRANKAKRTVRRRRNRLANSEFASAKQTIQLPDDTSNTIYRMDSVALSVFDRMCLIAKAYQYFRITKVEMKFKPFADTYAPNNGIATVPYFYWLIDKGTNIEANSFGALRDAGAKPIRFDDKTVSVSWKPAIHLMTGDVSGSSIFPTYCLQKVSPWLSTNQNAGQGVSTWSPNETEHYGLLYGVEVDSGSQASNQIYGTEITVHFQFKKPLNSPGNKERSVAVSKEIVDKAEAEVKA